MRASVIVAAAVPVKYTSRGFSADQANDNGPRVFLQKSPAEQVQVRPRVSRVTLVYRKRRQNESQGK